MLDNHNLLGLSYWAYTTSCIKHIQCWQKLTNKIQPPQPRKVFVQGILFATLLQTKDDLSLLPPQQHKSSGQKRQ